MSLQFNVSQLLKTDIGRTRTYEFAADEPLDLDEIQATDVHGAVKFTLTNFGIMADVHASGMLHLTCARCLESFDAPAEVSFTEEYRPTIDIATGQPSDAVQHSEMAFEISSNHTIDLTEALRQHLLLAVEIIPVCREDCQGLCPTCGVNRNLETCSCPPPAEPSPFAALQGLLSETQAE